LYNALAGLNPAVDAGKVILFDNALRLYIQNCNCVLAGLMITLLGLLK